MDFFDVIERRHSIRSFIGKPVEEPKLQAILRAANRAPSAGNLQAYEIYLVSDPHCRAALVKAALDQEFLAEAPIVLAFCAHPKRSAQCYGERGTKLYAVQDASIACCFAMLAVTALELACVWVGSFDEKMVRKALGAPEELMPVALLPIGYAAEMPELTPRRTLGNLVHKVE